MRLFGTDGLPSFPRFTRDLSRFVCFNYVHISKPLLIFLAISEGAKKKIYACGLLWEKGRFWSFSLLWLIKLYAYSILDVFLAMQIKLLVVVVASALDILNDQNIKQQPYGVTCVLECSMSWKQKVSTDSSNKRSITKWIQALRFKLSGCPTVTDSFRPTFYSLTFVLVPCPAVFFRQLDNIVRENIRSVNKLQCFGR